jgi:hypothetical protein
MIGVSILGFPDREKRIWDLGDGISICPETEVEVWRSLYWN